ncbi:hypothetical protein NQ315_015278 [Exocentrus adspersus]|uniref:Endonuclease/exonuclease/phosphatase domain-containing protein n=1 Tax=Exocentrus adspersus TaxID=1586481 RepID=A0AAV8VAH6_9CUCU|nr:hypothetical protein NQ315_015278 [Exocentrus adspersus]
MAVQRRMPESLRVASWNIDSFTARKHELQEFLTRLEIDVVALQETRLAENMSTKIPGYVVYRQDRNRRGGGVAVAIKRGIDHYMLQVPQLDTIEAVAVGIRTSRYGEVAVASCYHPPGRTILEQDIEALLTAEAFADSLELQCRENQLDDEDEEHTALVERRAMRIGQTPEDEEIRPTTPEEIKRILEHLNPRKAAGHDEIGNRILKKLPRKAVMALDGSDICRPRPRHDYPRGLDESAKKEEKTEERQKITTQPTGWSQDRRRSFEGPTPTGSSGRGYRTNTMSRKIVLFLNVPFPTMLEIFSPQFPHE